jgi:hypothetical protein
MVKVLKFNTEEFIDERTGELCVVASLARAAGRSVRFIKEANLGSDYSLRKTVMNKYGITSKQINTLINLNDQCKWTKLTNRLLSLELYHVVRPFAKGFVTTKTGKIKTLVTY